MDHLILIKLLFEDDARLIWFPRIYICRGLHNPPSKENRLDMTMSTNISRIPIWNFI